MVSDRVLRVAVPDAASHVSSPRRSLMEFVIPPVIRRLIVGVAVITFMAPLFAVLADDARPAAAAERDAQVTKRTVVLLDLNAKKFDRIAAAQELERSGRGSSQAAQALTKTLGDADPEVRGWAAVILVKVSRRPDTDLAAP